MAVRGIAGHLNEAAKAADTYIEAYQGQSFATAEELTQVIRQYIVIKLQLPQEEVSDNITKMVRCSISKATGIPVEQLKEMDRPGACGSAPAVLAKRILLFLDIQTKLGVRMPPDHAGNIQTVQDLAEELLPLLGLRDQIGSTL